MVDQPWDEALRSMLGDHGLVGIQDRDGNIRVERREVELARVEREAQVLRAALDEFARSGNVRIETLEASSAVRASSELTRLASDLVAARGGLRELRNRYSDDYPPIQGLLREIVVLEANYRRGLADPLAQLEMRAAELRRLGEVRP
jgi:hypothetical protein